MSRAAFLFTGCSQVVATREAGGGWVAVCDGAVAFGNATWRDMATVAEAEAASALAGARGALAAFPGIDRLLVSTDANEVQFAPWGDLAGEMDPALDRTGLIGECLAHGVAHAIRWHPGHRPGPTAPDILLLAARALAIQGRRGRPLDGRTASAIGWRSALSNAIGPAFLDAAPKSGGLTRAEARAVTGLDGRGVDALAAAGRLQASPHGGILLSSALAIRDALEIEGLVTWPGDDFGHGHLDEALLPPGARIHVGLHLFGDACGIGIARRRGTEVEAISARHPVGSGRDGHKAAMALTIDAVSDRIAGYADCGVDVVTTDPWLAMLLTGIPDAPDRIADALDGLRDATSARGVQIRPRLVKDTLLQRWVGNEPLALTAVAIGAARAAAFGMPFSARAATVQGSPSALLSRVEAVVADLALGLTRARQLAVDNALFGLVPDGTQARNRFGRLVADTQATYSGGGFVMRPVLPGAIDGHVALAGAGGAQPCGPSHAIGPELENRWRDWWRAYARMLEGNPVLALREALLRVDPDADPSRWPEAMRLSVEAWVRNGGEPPFAIRADRREPLRAEIGTLVEACGGWPASWQCDPVMAAA